MIKNQANYKYVTVMQAAEILGFSVEHVRHLILHEQLKAEKLGRIWLILRKSLRKIKRKRYPRTKE